MNIMVGMSLALGTDLPVQNKPPKAILAFAFGETGNSFDRVNFTIAEKVKLIANQNPGIWIFAQHEVAHFLEGRYLNIVSIKLPEGKTYMDTHECFQKMLVEIVERFPNGLPPVAIVAHPRHIQRCQATVMKRLQIARIDPIEEIYDQNSLQKHTRGKGAFTMHEFIAKIYYFLTGKI